MNVHLMFGVQWLLRQQEGQPFRAVVQANPTRIMNLATGPTKVGSTCCFDSFFVEHFLYLCHHILCLYNVLHRVGHEKRGTLLLFVSSPINDQFLKFFH